MNGGYTAIASMLLYFLLLRTLNSPKMNPKKAAVFFMLGSFALSAVVTVLENIARDMPAFTDVLTATRSVNLLVQFGAAYILFYKIEQLGDEYVLYILWGGFGFALIFYFIPQVIQALTGLL